MLFIVCLFTVFFWDALKEGAFGQFKNTQVFSWFVVQTVVLAVIAVVWKPEPVADSDQGIEGGVSRRELIRGVVTTIASIIVLGLSAPLLHLGDSRTYGETRWDGY